MSNSRPRRLQLRRSKGWRLPADAVAVVRPGRWGNPFVPDDKTAAARAEAVRRFAVWLTAQPMLMEAGRRALRGRHLACWCPPGEPCHADVWLQLVNEPEVEP